MDNIKTVIIGMGRMGKTRYEAMKRHGGFEIIAICDTAGHNMDGYKEKKYER